MTTPRLFSACVQPRNFLNFHLISFPLSLASPRESKLLFLLRKVLPVPTLLEATLWNVEAPGQRGSSSSSASVWLSCSLPLPPLQAPFKVSSGSLGCILLGRVLRLPGAINTTHITPFILLASLNCLFLAPHPPCTISDSLIFQRPQLGTSQEVLLTRSEVNHFAFTSLTEGASRKE